MSESQLRFFAVLFNFVRCELIADIVIMVIRVPLHFDKAHLMLLGLVDQRDPEIFIFNRLFLRIDPAVPLPGQSPAVMKSVADIGTIRLNRNLTGLFQRAKTHDHCCQLHAVVRRFCRIAGKLFFRPFIEQNRSPSAWPGIA